MMTLRRARVFLLIAIAGGVGGLTACMTSRPPELTPEATSPFGEKVSLTMNDGRRITGELLAVTDSNWILMVGDRVAAARFKDIRYLYQKSVGFVGYSSRKSLPPEATLTRARQGARFPGGIRADAMAAILAKSAQSAPDDMARMPP